MSGKGRSKKGGKHHQTVFPVWRLWKEKGEGVGLVGKNINCSAVLRNVRPAAGREPGSPVACWNGPAFVSHSAQSSSRSRVVGVQVVSRDSDWAISQ